jgi:hypothetical protein
MFHAIMATIVDTTIALGCLFLRSDYFQNHTMPLVFFTIYRSSQLMSRLTVQAEIEARRIVRPFALPRTASERALRGADQYENQAFHPRN